MTTATLYKHINEYIPKIQSLASKLSNDFDTARSIYLETVHLAFKNQKNLNQDTIGEWLMNTVKKTYSQHLTCD